MTNNKKQEIKNRLKNRLKNWNIELEKTADVAPAKNIIDYKNLNNLVKKAAGINTIRVSQLIDLHWKELISIENVVSSLEEIITGK